MSSVMKAFWFMTVVLGISPQLAGATESGTDPLTYSGPAWSPYLVGTLIGVLSMLTFYFSRKPLGASTAYARIAGMLGMAVAPKHTASLKYFQDNITPSIGLPRVRWLVPRRTPEFP